MNLFEFVISTAFVVSFALLISCVWNRLKKIFISKSKADNKSNHYNPKNVENSADNNQIIAINEDIVSQTHYNLYDGNGVESAQNTIDVDIPVRCENQDLKENKMTVSLRLVENCERLEHINKTRPKRSNIRRSTRKSKIETNSQLFEEKDIHYTLEGIQSNKESNQTNQMDLKQEISQKLSMFSMRIEEVTQPLPLSPLKTQQSLEDQHIFENSLKNFG